MILKREITVALLGALMASVTTGIGWAFLDRLQWAKNEEKLQQHSVEIINIERKLDAVPSDAVPRKEYEQLKEFIGSEQQRTRLELEHLSDRVDQLTIAVSSSRAPDEHSGYILPVPAPMRTKRR